MHLDTILCLIGDRETATAQRADQLREQIAALTEQAARLETELADLATTSATLLAATEFTARNRP
jgi:prefoldin subunit 5